MTRKKRLGRGLEALLGVADEVDSNVAVASQELSIDDDDSTSDVVHLSVYEIDDNPFQPRREFLSLIHI